MLCSIDVFRYGLYLDTTYAAVLEDYQRKAYDDADARSVACMAEIS